MATPKYIKDAQNNYNAKFDLIQIRLPKGTKERIKKITDSSMANFCLDAVMETIEAYEAAECYENEEEPEEIENDTPDKPMHPAPVKSADPLENVKPINGSQLDREKLEALQAEIERRKAKAEAEQEAKTAEQEAKEKDQRERAEAYNKEMQEHFKTHVPTGKWLSEGGYWSMIKRIINRYKERKEEKQRRDRERLIKDLEKRLNDYRRNIKK